MNIKDKDYLAKLGYPKVKLSKRKKQTLTKAVKKIVNQYGDVLKKLGDK